MSYNNLDFLLRPIKLRQLFETLFQTELAIKSTFSDVLSLYYNKLKICRNNIKIYYMSYRHKNL